MPTQSGVYLGAPVFTITLQSRGSYLYFTNGWNWEKLNLFKAIQLVTGRTWIHSLVYQSPNPVLNYPNDLPLLEKIKEHYSCKSTFNFLNWNIREWACDLPAPQRAWEPWKVSFNLSFISSWNFVFTSISLEPIWSTTLKDRQPKTVPCTPKSSGQQSVSRSVHVWLFATPWTVAHQALLSMEFSRQEYWSE